MGKASARLTTTCDAFLIYRCISIVFRHRLDLEQIEEYLVHLKKKGPSEADFKLTVFGLKFLFRTEGLDDQAIKLPSIKRDKKLPVVLSAEEMKVLLKVPTLLKHRVLIVFFMAADSVAHEVRALLIKDVDFDRNIIHVRQGKGRKDRYVPIGTNLSRGLSATTPCRERFTLIFLQFSNCQFSEANELD